MRRPSSSSIGLAALLLLLVALLVACTSEAEDKIQETATEPAAGKTLLIATQNMTSHSDDTTQTEIQTEVGAVERTRDEPFIMEQVASDPRATGSANVVLNVDIRADNSGELWGTWVLTNDDGTWNGEMSSTMSAETAAVPDTQYLRIDAEGSGAYEGLELHLSGTSGEIVEGFEPGTDIVVSGWIQKAD